MLYKNINIYIITISLSPSPSPLYIICSFVWHLDGNRVVSSNVAIQMVQPVASREGAPLGSADCPLGLPGAPVLGESKPSPEKKMVSELVCRRDFVQHV